MTVRIKLMPGGRIPVRATDGSAGMDCFAVEGGTLDGCTTELVPRLDRIGNPIDGQFVHEVIIDRRKVALGFAIELPPNHCAVIHPRSGLGAKFGVVAGIGANLIDPDYRGEVSALLFNLSRESFTWQAGERVAQMVIQTYLRAELEAVDELAVTVRGEGGYGHTGMK